MWCMNLDTRFKSSGGEFVNDFVEYGIARLVAIDADEQAQITIVHDDGKGLLAEFLEAITEGGEILVVFAGATIAEGLGGLPTCLYVSFRDVEEDDGFDLVAAGFCGVHHGVFFADPAADGREDKWKADEVIARKIGQDPLIENIGRDEIALVGEMLMSLGLFGTDNEARRKEPGV